MKPTVGKLLQKSISAHQAEKAVSANPSKQQLSCLLEYYQAGRYSSAEKLALSITQEFPKHKFGRRCFHRFHRRSKNSCCTSRL